MIPSSLRTIYHPATGQLLNYQTVAKLKRIRESFSNPRRQLLACVAIVLGLLWLSQAIATIFFRQAADLERLRLWLPMGLATYSLWHVIKIVSKKLEEPFDWTPAEYEWILAAPLSRAQQISYRMISIVQAALAKAVCFSLLMLPDIPVWYLGFAGILLGLLFVDLIRAAGEITFHALSYRWQWVVKIIILGSAGLAFLAMAARVWASPTSQSDLASPAALIFFQKMYAEFMGLGGSDAGQILLLPFRTFASVTLAPHLTLITCMIFLGAFAQVVALALAVYRLDRWRVDRRRALESAAMNSIERENIQSTVAKRLRVRSPWRLGGIGSLAWRQWVGAYHYRSAIIFSLAVPIFLSCLPLLAPHDPGTMLLHLVGGAVFYSFLLLPAALMLDFRRDINRMAVLKSLPISPLRVAVGQLAAPVSICWFFQAIVLAIGVLAGRVDVFAACGAGLLLFPINVVIFAVENYIFLISPYQRNREGFDVFLRTILTFTGKGVLFAIALAILVFWAWTAIAIIRLTGLDPLFAAVLFGGGVWLFGLSIATVFVLAIARLYQRFDPSQDTPG